MGSKKKNKPSRDSIKAMKALENNPEIVQSLTACRARLLQEMVEQSRASKEKQRVSKTVVSETDDSDDEVFKKGYKKFLQNQKAEREKDEPKHVRIPMSKYLLATQLLDSNQSSSKETENQARQRRLCRGTDTGDTLPYSSMCIFKAMRTSILKRDWMSVTKFLLVLLRRNKMYHPYVRKVAKLNFMMNPADITGRTLEQFLEFSKSQKSKEHGRSNRSKTTYDSGIE